MKVMKTKEGLELTLNCEVWRINSKVVDGRCQLSLKKSMRNSYRAHWTLPGPHELSTHRHNLLFNINLQPMSRSPKWSYPLRSSLISTCMLHAMPIFSPVIWRVQITKSSLCFSPSPVTFCPLVPNIFPTICSQVTPNLYFSLRARKSTHSLINNRFDGIYWNTSSLYSEQDEQEAIKCWSFVNWCRGEVPP